MTTHYRIGIDLGGTKTEAVTIDASGMVRARRRRPTPFGDYPGTIATIVAVVAAIEDEIGAKATVGIGIPGAISPASGLVKNANSTWLNGQPLRQDVEAALARPVRLANDANCFALS
jgi:fructokinase